MMTRGEAIDEIIDICQMDRLNEVMVEMVGEVLDKYVAGLDREQTAGLDPDDYTDTL